MKSYMRKFYILIFLTTLSIVNIVFGEKVFDETITVTATRVPQTIWEAPASVTVVSNSIFLRSSAYNVDDVLRNVAGVSVLQTVGIGYGLPSQINMRGVPGQHAVLLLFDGIQVNESFSGYMTINDIPLEAIRQIEIVRGGLSSLYGSDAMGGVINIISRELLDVPRTGFSIATGTDGYRRALFQTGEANKTSGYAVWLDERCIDNYLGQKRIIESIWNRNAGQYVRVMREANNYDYSDYRVLGKGFVKLNDDMQIDLQGRFYSGTLGYGVRDMRPLYPEVVDNQIENKRWVGSARLISGPETGIKLDAILSYQYQRREVEGLNFVKMSGMQPVFAPSRSVADGMEYQIQTLLSSEMSSVHVLSGGFDYRFNYADFSPLRYANRDEAFPYSVGRSANQWTAGVFLQDELTYANAGKLVAGIRFDKNSEDNDIILLPRIGTKYALSEITTIWTSASRSYRIPTLLERFQPAINFGSSTFESNPELEPERVTTFDLGLEQLLGRVFLARIAGFFTDMSDLIVTKVNGNKMTFENVEESHSQGLETEFSWYPIKQIIVTANYTRQNGHTDENNGKLPHLPQNIFSFGIRPQLHTGDYLFKGSLDIHHIGDRWYPDSLLGQWQKLDKYWRSDASLAIHYRDVAWVSMAVRNITDEKYQEWELINPAPGRMIFVEVGINW